MNKASKFITTKNENSFAQITSLQNTIKRDTDKASGNKLLQVFPQLIYLQSKKSIENLEHHCIIFPSDLIKVKNLVKFKQVGQSLIFAIERLMGQAK